MNASADLTVSVFRAPVRRASPSCMRALVSAVLPLHLFGVQAWWQAADLDGGSADPIRPVKRRSAVKMAAVAWRAHFGPRATGQSRPLLNPRRSAEGPWKALRQYLLVTALPFPNLQHKRGPLRTATKG